MSLRILCSALVLALAGSAAPRPAHSQQIVISSGQEDGYYHSVARRMRTVLRTQLDTVAELRPSRGSVTNLRALGDPDSPVNVVLAQADAMRAYLDDYPDFAMEGLILGDLGNECAFIVTRQKDGVQDMAQLISADPKAVLGVAEEQTGAALTWEYLSRMEPSFRNTRLVRLGMLEALLQLKLSAQISNMDAVMFMQRPRAVPPLELVLENQDAFRFVGVREGEVPAGELPGGRPVYTFEKVKVGFGTDFSAEVETFCTRGLLVGSNSKLTPEQIRLLSLALLDWGGYILPGK